MATSQESECTSALCSSSKDVDSESDLLEQSSFVEPYTNEPLASSGDEFEQTKTNNEDGISSQRLAQRYEKEIPIYIRRKEHSMYCRALGLHTYDS